MDPLGPITIDAAGKVTLDLPQGIQHQDYLGIILWNTSGYILNIVPNYNEAGTITIPPSNGVKLGNDWDYSIPVTVTSPGGTPVSGVLAGTIYYLTETVPPAPNINPTNIAAIVESGTITVTGTVDVSSGTIDIGNTPSVTVGSGTIDIGNTPTVNISAGQLVEVQNASGGSLTVAGTVDAAVTGNVTIDAGTVNIQPVESEHLATTTSGVFPTVTPSPNAIGLAIISDCSLVTVTGVQTGARYPVQIANPDVINQAPLLWYSPICIGEDTSYNVTTNLSNGDSYLDEVFSGITAVINPVIDGGDLSILLTTFSNTANTGFGSPPGSTVVKILSTSGGPNIFPRVSDVSDNPPTPPGPIAPYYPVRLLTTLIDGSTWWEVDVIPNHSYWVTFVDGFFNQVACSGKIYSSSKSSGWPTSKTTFTVTVPNPATATEWNYTLPFPARLIKIAAVLQTSSAVGTRIPSYVINGLGPRIVMCDSNGITASNAYWFDLIRGDQLQTWGIEMGPDNQFVNQCPDLGILPPGAVIESNTLGSGLLAGDQWQSIQLVLEPA